VARYDVAVVGPGSLGLLYAVMLWRTGADVLLVARSRERVEALRRGVVLEAPGQRVEARIPAVAGEGLSGVEADVVLVTVKAYDTPAAAPVAARLAGDRGLILTLQNGVGNDRVLEEHAPGRVLQGVTTWGAYRLGPARVRLAGEGRTLIPRPLASLDHAHHKLYSLLEAAGLNPEVVDDIRIWQWRKLAVNAGINPVTALARVRNRAVSGDPRLGEVAMAAAREAGVVARSLGLRVGDPDELARDTIRVAEETGDNISSMLQDVLACRRTEVDWINGEVVRVARRLGIEVPVNTLLYRLVKGWEEAGLCAPTPLETFLQG